MAVRTRLHRLIATILVAVGLLGSGPAHHALHGMVLVAGGTASSHCSHGLASGHGQSVAEGLASTAGALPGSDDLGESEPDGLPASEQVDCAACGFLGSVPPAFEGLLVHALEGPRPAVLTHHEVPTRAANWAKPSRGPPA